MGDSYPPFTVAAVQAASVMFDREKSTEKATRLIQEAADKGASIIGLPELFISGHPNVWYRAKKSNPLTAQARLFKQLVKNSVKVPSPVTDSLAAAAKKAHAYVVIGITEADPLYPGTLYVSQLFLSDSGEILGVHRKLLLAGTEKMIFTLGDGSYLNVYDTRYGKLSAMLCSEHSNSLYKYAVAAMGAQIHVAAWAPFPARLYPGSESVQIQVRQYASEARLFLLNCCAITDRQNIEACCDTQEEKNDIVENTGGGTAVIGPNGEYLAGPVYENEAILTAQVSLEDALAAKSGLNILGSSVRWDVLSLNFNRQRLGPIKGPPPPES